MWEAVAAMGAQTGLTMLSGGLTAGRNRRALREAKRAAAEDADETAREIYVDPTGNASAQGAITRMNKERQDRAEARRGTQAVMGGTNASVASGNEADAQAEAQTMSNVVAQGQARRDQLKAQDRAQRARHRANIAGIQAKQDANLIQAGLGVAQAGAGIASAYMGDTKAKSSTASTLPEGATKGLTINPTEVGDGSGKISAVDTVTHMNNELAKEDFNNLKNKAYGNY